jgi:hypothetical protein
MGSPWPGNVRFSSAHAGVTEHLLHQRRAPSCPAAIGAIKRCFTNRTGEQGINVGTLVEAWAHV